MAVESVECKRARGEWGDGTAVSRRGMRHWREARGPRDHAGALRQEAGGHGDHAGGVEDFFFEFLLDALFFALFEDFVAFFFGDEAGVDADAEHGEVEHAGID